MKKTLFGLVAVALFGLLVWSSDRITMQGERTIYTVNCEQGTWTGAHCSGRLVPGARHAFRVSALRHEVIFWIRGTTDPSGTYSDCAVVDRDNWTCNVREGQAMAIAYEMKNGRPTRGGQGLAASYHDVAKWKWWALRIGVPGYFDADG